MHAVIINFRTSGLAAIAGVLMLSACDTEQLPVGAELKISPDTRTIDIVEQRSARGSCLLFKEHYVDLPLVLALTDAQGTPIGGTDIRVYVDFAANTFSGFPALALYDDREGNSNGVIDGDSELISDANDAIATVRTGRFGGDRVLLLRVNVSCGYSGTVFAFADGVTASSSITVNATNDDGEDNEGDGEEEDEEGD